MGQIIEVIKKKYWRKKKTSRGMGEPESKFKRWIKAAAIRAVRTMAQAALATIGTGAALSEINWRYVISVSIVSGILSILTALTGLPEVDTENRME